jgi:hypothetical protein
MANPKAKIHLVYKKERKIKARVQIATHESNRKQAAQSYSLAPPFVPIIKSKVASVHDASYWSFTRYLKFNETENRNTNFSNRRSKLQKKS